MHKKVYLVSGSKGGVGKSFAAMATIDALERFGEKVLLVESDNTNSDVAKCYGEHTDVQLINLEKANGWIEFLDLCNENPDKTIVVNTRAANQEGLQEYARMARDGLRELERPLVVLWVINTQRDSVELLRDFVDLLPGTEVHVVRNLFYARESDFGEFERSRVKEKLAAQGCASPSLPVLASYVTDQLYNRRLTVEAARKVSFGLRQEINRWRNLIDADESLGRVLR